MAREESICSALAGNIDLFVNSDRNSWDTADAVPANAGCVRSAGHGTSCFMPFVLALVFN